MCRGNSELGLTNLPSLHHHLDKKNYPTDLRIFSFFFLKKIFPSQDCPRMVSVDERIEANTKNKQREAHYREDRIQESGRCEKCEMAPPADSDRNTLK